MMRFMGQALGKALNEGVRLRELWAWAMYDFANSGYTTVILTSVYSAYFVGVVAEGRSWATLAWTLALSASYLSIMLTMPGLGAKADARQGKKATFVQQHHRLCVGNRDAVLGRSQ